jgi:hypothetical protein
MSVKEAQNAREKKRGELKKHLRLGFSKTIKQGGFLLDLIFPIVEIIE